MKYSESPVLYVLETPRGWLAEHGVTVGDTAVIVFGESGAPVALPRAGLQDPPAYRSSP